MREREEWRKICETRNVILKQPPQGFPFCPVIVFSGDVCSNYRALYTVAKWSLASHFKQVSGTESLCLLTRIQNARLSVKFYLGSW